MAGKKSKLPTNTLPLHLLINLIDTPGTNKMEMTVLKDTDSSNQSKPSQPMEVVTSVLRNDELNVQEAAGSQNVAQKE